MQTYRHAGIQTYTHKHTLHYNYNRNHITVQYSTLHYTTDKRTYGHTDIQADIQTCRHTDIQRKPEFFYE
jgi:hypothetical protein